MHLTEASREYTIKGRRAMYLSFLYRFYLGSKFTVVVTDLDMMKEVFVKQFDNFADRGSIAVSF